MDERTLSELLECSVCLDRLDTSSKVLPCQHTFCRRCLDEIVSTKNELRCPECRSLVDVKVEDLPSNILLIRLLEGMKTSGSGVASVSACTSPSSPRQQANTPTTRTANKLNVSQPCAKALYNYDAKEPGDLSFKKGDIVLLRKQVDENWYHGDLNGQSGFFPATYVQVITALPPQEIPKCTALYDFIIHDENEKDCLNFHKNEVVTVIRRIDEHWAEGKLLDKIGIFPISFVDLNDSAKWLINNQLYSSSSHVQHSQSLHIASTMSQTGSVASTPMSPSDPAGYSRSSHNTPIATALVAPQQPVLRRRVYHTKAFQSQVAGTEATSANGDVPTTIGILITTASSTSSVSSPATSSAVRPTSIVSPSSHNKRHSFTSIGEPALSLPVTNHRHSLELSSSGCSHDVLTSPMTAEQPSVTSTAVTMATGAGAVSVAGQPATKSNSAGIFMALYNYKPQKEDEVELTKGAYYLVSQKCQDGWYKGTCLRTGTVGVFPGNYVQMVRLPASVKNAPPKRGPVRSPTGTSTNESITPTSTHAGAANNLRLTRTCVNRTHSFPKTSPHHLDTHGGRSSSNQTPAKGPSKTITNVTQALSRCMVTITTTTAPGCAPYSGGATSVTSVEAGATTTSTTHSTATDTVMSVTSSDRSHVCANPGAITYSPKSSRRPHHHHHKHSSSRGHTSRSGHSSPVSEVTSLGANSPLVSTAAAAETKCTESSAVRTAQWVNSSSNRYPAASSVATAAAAPEKTAKDKKERSHHVKRNESLLKRLATAGIPLRGRKSKSPPPAGSDKRHTQHSTHQRSGSEGSILEGATAATVTASASSTKKSGDKPAKVKPLAKERYRCVVPYPPQSDIELELKMGDVIYVHKKREDGWLKGTLQRTGKTGLVPCSFLHKF